MSNPEPESNPELSPEQIAAKRQLCAEVLAEFKEVAQDRVVMREPTSKKLLGKEGESELNLTDLVNGVFRQTGEPEIASVRYVNVEQIPDIIDGKTYRLDILAMTDRGDAVNVEIQILCHNCFLERVVRQMARIHGNGLAVGEKESATSQKTYCIVITNFNPVNAPPQLFWDFRFRTLDEPIVQIDGMALIICDISQIPHLIGGPINLDENLLTWLILLSYPNIPDNILLEAMMKNPLLVTAIKSLTLFVRNRIPYIIHSDQAVMEREIRNNPIYIQDIMEVEKRADERTERALEAARKEREEAIMETTVRNNLDTVIRMLKKRFPDNTSDELCQFLQQKIQIDFCDSSLVQQTLEYLTNLEDTIFTATSFDEVTKVL